MSSVSPTASVYRHTGAASPALDLSASVAFSCRKTSACVMKCLSERIYALERVLSHAEYTRSCITAEDGMGKQHIVANCTSQHSLHILDVPASWTLLCSGPDLWFEEDFTRIFLDMITQKHKEIRVIANQGSFARHCRL